MENECRIVHACGVCEEICEPENVKQHSCLEGYNNYMIDENSLYFYPVLDDGITIVRRSEIDNQEKLVAEQFQQASTSTTTANKRMPLKISKSKFNFDEEEVLILEVQNRPALWDYVLPLKDRSTKIKKQLWEEISQILNGKFSIEILKLKFKSLHDTFRKIIQSENHASGSARKDSGRKWPHYESMQFLRDLCLFKNTISNIDTRTDERERTPNTDLSINDENEDVESIQTESTERKKKGKKHETTNAMERIADAICQSNNIVLPPPPVPDEIDSFLSMLGHRLRRMSPRI